MVHCTKWSNGVNENHAKNAIAACRVLLFRDDVSSHTTVIVSDFNARRVSRSRAEQAFGESQKKLHSKQFLTA